MDKIPIELINHILGYCTRSPSSIFSLCLVNKDYYLLIGNKNLWFNAYKVVLPKCHYALLLQPISTHWNYSSIEIRCFLYLIEKERKISGYQSKFNEVEQVIHLLTKYKDNYLVYKAGCYVVRRLTFYIEASEKKYRKKVEKARKCFGQKNTIELFMDALKKYEKDPDMTARILCALGNLAIDESNKERLVNNKIIQITKDLLINYYNDEDIVDYGCFVLTNVADKREDFKLVIEKENIISLAIEYLSNAKCPINICGCLLELLGITMTDRFKLDNKDFLITLVYPLIKSNDNNDEFLTKALIFLSSIIDNCTFSEFICIKDGNLENFIPFLYKFTTYASPKVIESSALCLFILLWNNYHRNNWELISHEYYKFIDFILKTMVQNKSSVVIQRTFAGILGDFSSLNTLFKQYIESNNGIEIIVNAVDVQWDAWNSIWKTILGNWIKHVKYNEDDKDGNINIDANN